MSWEDAATGLLMALAMTALVWSGPASAQESDEDEPVGWPLKSSEERETPEPDPDLPEPSEVTARAIEEWSAERGSIPRQSPEVAPLDRFTPDIMPFRIEYESQAFALATESARELAKLAVRLRGTNDHIEIIAHSGDVQLSTHEAVKLSFKRAMLIRTFLLEEGVTPDQIHLRALAQAEDGGPADRVDIRPLVR